MVPCSLQLVGFDNLGEAMAELKDLVEVKSWEEPGYQPLILSDGWQVAILNYVPLLSPEKLEMVERHCKTDELFLLLSGSAWLLVAPKGDEVAEVDVLEMERHKLYNVLAGVWHGLVASEDARWLIVENKDTHLADVEYRKIPEEQRERISSKWPR